MRLPTIMDYLRGPAATMALFGAHHAGRGQRSLYTVHKKAGESAKEREWARNGGGRIRPSMAGSTDSSERLA